MPSLSMAQHRAMEAAKSGHSTLGIPKSVGAEFAGADEEKGEGGLKGLPARAPKAKGSPLADAMRKRRAKP